LVKSQRLEAIVKLGQTNQLTNDVAMLTGQEANVAMTLARAYMKDDVILMSHSRKCTCNAWPCVEL